jgi:hypothetical protein
MRSMYIMVIIALIIVSLSGQVNAMRCGGKLVRVGDTVYKLIKHCGRPLMVSYGDWGMSVTYTYEIYGREQAVLVRNGLIVGGV